MSPVKKMKPASTLSAKKAEPSRWNIGTPSKPDYKSSTSDRKVQTSNISNVLANEVMKPAAQKIEPKAGRKTIFEIGTSTSDLNLPSKRGSAMALNPYYQVGTIASARRSFQDPRKK